MAITAYDLDTLPAGSVIQTTEGVLERREATEWVGADDGIPYLAWFDTDAAEYSSSIVAENQPIRILSVGRWDGKS